MLSQLNGILIDKTNEALTIDVNGVGYEVTVSKANWEQLPTEGEKILLFIHTHVTESSLSLYGFLTKADKTLFTKLISVSGIGPKLGIQILSGMTGNDLMSAIIDENLAVLTGINGIGKKTAERLVVELKDKLIGLATASTGEGSPLASKTAGNQTYHEALSALVNLGYHKNIAERALTKIKIKPSTTVEEIIKHSLNVLSL